MVWQVVNMIRKLCVTTLAVLLVFLSVPHVSAEAPSVSAYAAVLLDPVSGTVLYEKNGREVLPMASTTKIMTALLAFESGRAEETVKVTKEMVTVEGSSMGLQSGDRLTLGAIAQGMMMASGNDGANAIALFLGGSAEGFAECMNARAAEIGMTQTNFVTPSGLDAEGHGTTAYDMALLGAAAMDCPAFAETAGSRSLTVEFASPQKQVRYENHNRLLQLYEDCTGIKTGFTKKAGRCLVSSAERDGARLICVTLNAPDDWDDHAALFDYGFSQLQPRTLSANDAAAKAPVVGGVLDNVRCHAQYDVALQLPEAAQTEAVYFLPRFLYAPVQIGDTVGHVEYRVNGKTVSRVPLLAGEASAAVPDARGAFEKWMNRHFG